jgi:S-adenosylmethionine hydrolase
VHAWHLQDDRSAIRDLRYYASDSGVPDSRSIVLPAIYGAMLALRDCFCVSGRSRGWNERASVAKLKNGSYVVTPDNGTLTFLHDMIGVEEIREIDEKTNRYQKTKNVSVFHGRDLFAYCAAKLAAGKITYEEVGPEYPVEEIILHELHHAEVTTGDVKAMIQGYDPFGSAEVSVRNEEFVQAGFQLGERLRVSVSDAKRVILDKEILYERSFGYVPKGEDVLFQDLASFVTIASNEANFKEKYGLCEEQQYKVRIRRTNK